VRLKSVVLIMAVCFSMAPPGAMAKEDLKRVSLVPQWIPQAQFAGYMVALEKGFYREAGLDLTLIRGGPDKPPIDMLKSGAATFCIAWLSSAIKESASGLPLVNLGQVVQRCAFLIVAMKNRGIDHIKDLQDKKVGLWEGALNIPPRVFFQKHGITVRVVPNYTTVTLFLKGAVDAMSAMWYNEYHLILNAGLNPDELAVFLLKDAGVNFPEDGMYCLERTYRSDPEMCIQFARASLKGWQYAFAHEEEALDIVMNHARRGNKETNRAHQRWMLARMQDLVLPGGNPAFLGRLDPAVYEEVGRILLEYGITKRLPGFKDFFRGPQ